METPLAAKGTSKAVPFQESGRNRSHPRITPCPRRHFEGVREGGGGVTETSFLSLHVPNGSCYEPNRQRRKRLFSQKTIRNH